MSAAIASVQITLDSVNGGAPSTGAPLSATTNLTITSCPCTVYGPSVPPGIDTFTLTAYDQPNASGNLLSTATPTYTIIAGQANNESVTLNGVPASFAVAVPSATAGTPFATPQTISVTVKDGDGNTIMGTYANPVTITDGDSSGATSIATSGSDSPPSGELLSSSDAAAMTYTGLAIAPAAITASARGVASGSARFAPALQPITITTLDAQNPSFAGVDLYATTGAGSTGTFTASEIGWTNAPYNQSFVATTASSCASIATVAPASGTSFTATVAGAPAAGTCALTLADGSGQMQNATLAYTQFTYTGMAQTMVLPPGVTSIVMTAYGAQGAAAFTSGGSGGEAQGTLTLLVADETFYVYVGGQGSGASAGFDGGGAGFSGGGGGGGASDVRIGNNILANRAIVAAGGGGSGTAPGTTGGNGGGATGSAGPPGPGGASGGGGASQSAGGAAASSAEAGGLGYGGYADGTSSGGGGGGGYYGGGGGAFTGGGGGGSSYIDPAATSASTIAGVQTGNGLVILIW